MYEDDQLHAHPIQPCEASFLDEQNLELFCIFVAALHLTHWKLQIWIKV